MTEHGMPQVHLFIFIMAVVHILGGILLIVLASPAHAHVAPLGGGRRRLRAAVRAASSLTTSACLIMACNLIPAFALPHRD